MAIAILQAVTVRNEATVHARLAEHVRPDNPILAMRLPGFDFSAPRALTMLDAEIGRQASMMAYVDSFWLLFVAGLAIMPLVLLVRPSRKV